MKNEFILYKGNSKQQIIVNETSNNHLLKRCQDHWCHKNEYKYLEATKWYQKLSKKEILKKLNTPEYLFIHVPKTGGTSFKFNVIHNPNLTKKVGIYHRIQYPPSEKTFLNIFKEKKQMFTLLRDPTNMVISTYFHFNHIVKMGKLDFFERFTNMQTKFLLGYDMFSNYEVKAEDCERIKKLISEKKLTVGIQKKESMLNIYKLLDLPKDKVDDYILNKKIGINYKTNDIPDGVRKRIKKINEHDYSLFEYALNA